MLGRNVGTAKSLFTICYHQNNDDSYAANLRKNAAQASMRRRSGEDKVARKKKIMDSMHAKELARKHARARKIRHDRINGEVKDQT